MFITQILIATIAASAYCQYTLIPLPQYPGPISFEGRNVDFGNPDHGFFSATIDFSPSSGAEYHFYTTDDGGMTWTYRYSEWNPWFTPYFLTAVNSDTCFIAYNINMGYNLFRISESGSVSMNYYNYPNWIEEPVNVCIFDDSIQYCTSKRYGNEKHTYSVLYKLHGDTMTQILLTNRDTLEIIQPFFISPNSGFLITKNASDSKYSVFKTIDECHSFQMSFSTDSLAITDIDFFSSTTGLISCSKGVLFKTTDSGQSWYAVNSGINETINCLDVVNDQVGYFGGNSGKFYRTTDQGESWKEIPTPINKNILKLRMFGYGQGYLIYENESCYRYAENSAVIYPQEVDQILVYPNPAYDKIIVEFPFATKTRIEICLIDITGKTLYQSNHSASPVIIDLSSFCNGIYILVINREDLRWEKKIVVF